MGGRLATRARERAEGVRFEELRAMLRLTTELHDLPPASTEQRVHMLEGLCRLVGAQVGLWLDLEEVPWPSVGAPGLVLRDALDVGWSGERERRVFLTYLRGTQSQSMDPSLPPIARQMQSPFSAKTRAELLTDRDWYRSEHVQEYRRAAGVDSFVYVAHRPGAGTRAEGLSLHRPWGERPFSERERRLVEAFHHESAWIMRARGPRLEAAVDRDLPPRLRDTLHGLLRGLGEKQVAAELGLSQHTVHEYVKALHRRFGVSSRGELLARFLGDR